MAPLVECFKIITLGSLTDKFYQCFAKAFLFDNFFADSELCTGNSTKGTVYCSFRIGH